jgi:hypothetical protein
LQAVRTLIRWVQPVGFLPVFSLTCGEAILASSQVKLIWIFVAKLLTFQIFSKNFPDYAALGMIATVR